MNVRGHRQGVGTSRRVLGSVPRVVHILLAVALAGGVPLSAQAPTSAVYPGETWEVVRRDALPSHGWSPEALARTYEFIRDSAYTTGLVVVDGGRVVFTYGDVQELSYLASVRKSILAMLYGRWVENGTIDVEATLGELGMDDVGGLLDIEKRARVLDLITARSGVYHAASNGGDDLASAPERGSQEPGSYMLYNNWDFNAAGAVFERVTGSNIYDELEQQLAVPLEFEDWDREAQRKSGNLSVSVNPAYHIWLSTRDMARVGYLMLREGSWNGRQVLSRDWVRRITGVVTPLEEMNPPRRREGYFGYGYMWWVWDGPRAVGPFEGAYTGRGAIGQWITVFPALDLVVAHKTNSVYGRTTSWASWQRMIELLFEAKGVRPQGPWPWQ